MEIVVTILLSALILFLSFLVWKLVAFPFCPDELMGQRMQGAIIGVLLLTAASPTFLIMDVVHEVFESHLDLKEAHLIRIELTLSVYIPFLILLGNIADRIIATTNPDYSDWLRKRKMIH